MFLPYRTDLEFTRIPVVAWLVCMICIAVFYQQQQSERGITDRAEAFCRQDHPRLFWVTLKKLTGEQVEDACPQLLAWILAAWYVGWDIYSLTHDDGSSHTNFVAHVSGAAIGYLGGFALFRTRKEWANTQLSAV